MTIYAEKLLRCVCRAFFPDDCVMIVDVLVRDKYLRDDEDMEARLKLPLKEIRQIMTFLKKQHIVSTELVDDLVDGGGRSTQFFYIDYYRAVQVLSLRIHFLFERIREREKAARGAGTYECCNYKLGICNGQYSLLEAQNCVDFDTKMFLCAECKFNNDASLDPKDPTTYQLLPVDDEEELKKSMNDMAKVKKQLSEEKYPNSDKIMREGLMELLHKIRSSKVPLSSNLPSENYALGRGSKRIEGTGRTATAKAKMAAKEAEALGLDPEEEAQRGKNSSDAMNVLYLKGAHGDEFNLVIDQEGGAEAVAMASRGKKRGLDEIQEAARTNYEREVDAVMRNQKAKEADERKKNRRLGKGANSDMDFLVDKTIRGGGDGGNAEDDREEGQGGENGEGHEKGGIEHAAAKEEEEEDGYEKAEKLRAYHEAYQRELQQQMKLLAEAESSSDDSDESDDEKKKPGKDNAANEKDAPMQDAPMQEAPALDDDDDDDDDVDWE
jgi:transcription initiation factor TFIIE subunit alpha